MPSKMPASAKTVSVPAPARRAARSSKPTAKFRMRIQAGDVIAIGPGKVTLLEAIAETGSITAAAKHLDMSYRRAWMLLDELNRCLRQPAIDSAKGGTHGGGSEVTATGRKIIALYRRVEETASIACKADVAELVGLIVR
jgi:molybdate transport system regulatory protein